MEINYIQISNVLSFAYAQDISQAQKISFSSGLNIIIGENGSGKSTALEVINFLFKRVLYKQYNLNQELMIKRTTLFSDERKQILQAVGAQNFAGFRLEPNWNSENNPQVIRVSIKLDEIDKININNLISRISDLENIIKDYSNNKIKKDDSFIESYVFDITMNRSNHTFTIDFIEGNENFGFTYLSEYHFFKESISIYNLINPENPIDTLFESFTIISSYRNYHEFQPSISLKDAHPSQQIQQIKNLDYKRSLNISDKSEPPIFGLVRLQVAERHFELISKALSEDDCEREANLLPFIISINNKLKIVNLQCKIKLLDLRTWQYSFEFFDIRRSKPIADINSLSAGQKAIIHLVFEAYGRGDLKGGVVIIDEPEIHLHYQFQHEYLQVIRDLNRDQNCQYILVTHSEALINSSTINNVRRFALSDTGNTQIFSPSLDFDQKNLIKILDNTRSTYAFFAGQVILTEGDTDRYFIRALIQEIYPDLDQKVAVLHIGGKGEFSKWRKLFSSFGLQVFIIADFDYIIDLHYPVEKGNSLKTPSQVSEFKIRNPDWEDQINNDYAGKIFILKEGDLELYLGIRKDLKEVIEFCRNSLSSFLQDGSSRRSKEIKFIMKEIVE